jgi:Zn-finger nucleic acid-binding protein
MRSGQMEVEKMRCPDCKQAMLILEYEGVELDFCPACKGCWLDEGELEQIVDGREAALAQFDWQGGVKGARRCPRCMAKMRVVTMPNEGPELDLCPAACGIWFDRGELRAAIRAHAPDRDTAQIIRTLTEMFGSDESLNEGAN